MGTTIDEERPARDPATTGGLSSHEARQRLRQFGANAIPDHGTRPWRRALEKFWAPVPWMLEAAVALELVLGRQLEAAVIAALLAFNAVLSLFQEGRAQQTLAALKSRLSLTASVRRDGAWTIVPAAELVPGDMIKLSLGGVVPADAVLTEGNVLLDQSMLTGESVPIEAHAGTSAFASALVRRGEALAQVTATGTRTRFGRTAELVRTAHVISSQQIAVMRVVRNLVLFAGGVTLLLGAYAGLLHLPLNAIVPLVLTALLGSIPVALPATFTLAAALGARALARQGVLPTRLAAVDEAGTMDVLCVDKTGTLTANSLTVASVQPMPGFDSAQVLALAALASSEGGHDPVDAAIRAAAGTPGPDAPALLKFVPFDPALKMAEALVAGSAASVPSPPQRIIKGAYSAVSALAKPQPASVDAAAELESQGFRLLAVAVGPPRELQLAGLIALSDPPRADSAALLNQLRAMGVRTVMVTGDAPQTAATVARAVGVCGGVCPPGGIPPRVTPGTYGVYAGFLPEDKFTLVRAFQSGGATVGMCGDGANDAPALRQAQIGIAVCSATDVAKAAAGVVLLEPGLSGIVAAVREGRTTFQRIQNYAINSITKKIVTVLFLLSGLLMTGQAVLTPLLMVIVMIAGDFLAMALTTDRVRPTPAPNVWRVDRLTIAGVLLGVSLLGFCSGVLAIGAFAFDLPIAALQTLSFLALVFGSQAVLYAIRGRPRLWSLRPGPLLAASTILDVAIASGLALAGVGMAPVRPGAVLALFLGACAFAVTLDWVKSRAFSRLGIA
jgi:H+-transporting ATPase